MSRDTLNKAKRIKFSRVSMPFERGKFDLIKEFGLRGPGYWQIMQLFRANWILLEGNFEIER